MANDIINLVKFPAAFFDAHGYIVFQTKEDYNECSYLQLGQDVNVNGAGISSIPGYKRFQEEPSREVREGTSVYRPSVRTPEQDNLQFTEGAIEELIVELKRRDPKLRVLAIQKYGTDCQVCGFDFASFYGDLGAGYIEVHHVRPLSMDTGTRNSTVADVTVVCANCHRMLHRKGRDAFSIQELKARIQRRG